MSDIKELRALARKLIDTGKLPNTTNPLSVQGARVQKDTRCLLCGEFIKAGEFRYAVVAESKVLERHRYDGLHFLCCAAWQLAAAGVDL